jgi:bis(5'-adenosyl)-triphosphatase
MTCPFCDAEIIRKEEFHATRHFLCFSNHKPVLPGHSLIIPKRHVETILDMNDEELHELAPLMKKLAAILMKAYGCSGVDIALQDGAAAGASVAHLHWHVVPRKAGDIDGDPSLWMAKIIEAERGRQTVTDEEMRAHVERIRRDMK